MNLFAEPERFYGKIQKTEQSEAGTGKRKLLLPMHGALEMLKILEPVLRISPEGLDI